MRARAFSFRHQFKTVTSILVFIKENVSLVPLAGMTASLKIRSSTDISNTTSIPNFAWKNQRFFRAQSGSIALCSQR